MELLKNDEKVKRADNVAYDKMPVFPYRTIIKAVLGKKGFVKLVLKVRDKMLETKYMNLSWCNLEYLKSILPSIR